jgi:hypothetical protein
VAVVTRIAEAAARWLDTPIGQGLAGLVAVAVLVVIAIAATARRRAGADPEPSDAVTEPDREGR